MNETSRLLPYPVPTANLPDNLRIIDRFSDGVTLYAVPSGHTLDGIKRSYVQRMRDLLEIHEGAILRPWEIGHCIHELIKRCEDLHPVQKFFSEPDCDESEQRKRSAKAYDLLESVRTVQMDMPYLGGYVDFGWSVIQWHEIYPWNDGGQQFAPWPFGGILSPGHGWSLVGAPLRPPTTVVC